MSTDGGLVRVMNPQVLRDWAQECVARLEELRGEINDLNVFPIPDSDTGSNMLFTMRSAADVVTALPVDADVVAVTRAMAEGAVANARGNSGVIMSQILVGLADAVEIGAPDGQLTFSQLAVSGLRLDRWQRSAR